MSVDEFSKKTIMQDDRRPRKLPPITAISGPDFVYSPEIIKILQEFDLEDGKFIPTEFYAKDGETQLNLLHQYWNIGVRKNTFVPDESVNINREMKDPSHPMHHMFRKQKTGLNDDDLALTSACHFGPDIWIEENFRNIIFFKDRVVQRLKDAKLDEWFNFRSCRVVDQI